MRIEGLRVMVTGGAGFIGSHLVDLLLAKKNKVIVLDDFSAGKRENLPLEASKKSLEIICEDICNYNRIQSAFQKVDIVFHLATNCVRLSLTEPLRNHEVNATGTLNCLLAAKKNHVRRFVYCSSSEVYGNISQTLGKEKKILLSEESEKKPSTVYGASKLVGEYYALSFNETYGLDTIVVRPFNAYGPRAHITDVQGELIPRFITWIQAGANPVIFGDGMQTRDFTYVTDSALGIFTAGECDTLVGSDVNIAHGEAISILDIGKKISDICKKKFQPKFINERPGDIRELAASTLKAKKILNFVAKTDIDSGLQKYISWLNSQSINFTEMAKKISAENWKKDHAQ